MERRTVIVTVVGIASTIAGCQTDQSVDEEDSIDTPSTATQSMTPSPLVRGRIVFEGDRPDLTGATIYIRLEDVSRADTAAEIVSERVIREPAERVTPDGISFTLPEKQSDIGSQRRYSVAVHVDMDGSETVTEGDYISPDLNLVLTHGHPDHVTVSVRPVS